MQTVWGPLFRRQRFQGRRERVVTSDGDFVDLDWAAAEPAGAPILLVLHGLEGSSRSHYAVGLMGQALERGWRAVTLNFRSCSGELNRLRPFYHSGHTADLDEVVHLLVARDPDARLGAVGVSLGGNVLLKWLGEREADVPDAVVGVAAISVPFNLTPCAEALPDPADLPPWIRAEFVSRGGHAAFLEGRWPWRVRSWAERRVVDFLAPLVTGAGAAAPGGSVC